jgi:hypothetical protein
MSAVSASEAVIATLATSAGLAATILEQLATDGSAPTPLAAGLAGAVTIGFAVLLFVGAVPRAKRRAVGRPAQTALITSCVGFLSVASAWTGLPFVLGTGGAMLGTAARRGTDTQRERTLATFAVALGVGAVALGFVTVVAL